MKLKYLLEHKLLVSFAALVLTALFVLREYFNGGVITHHLLADPEMPGASNWWGLLTLSALTWVALVLIEQRQKKKGDSPAELSKVQSVVFTRFFIALGFGILISLMWELGLDYILQYLILLPLAIALFKPVHYPECLLGLVLGMLYAFGGILPIIVGCVLMLLAWVVHSGIRGGVLYLASKF